MNKAAYSSSRGGKRRREVNAWAAWLRRILRYFKITSHADLKVNEQIETLHSLCFPIAA